MRCKKHYTDLSSSIGVCACCFRERLLSLIAAKEQSIHNLDGKQRIPSDAPSRKFDHSVAPAALHNSHHPHAPRRHHTLSDQQFYTTPAVKKKSFNRFFSFQNIFRSKNRNSIDSVCDLNNATSSSSWFSTIIHGGRHRRKPTICLDETGVVRRKHCRDRGMSPVRNSDLGNGDEVELQNAINGFKSVEKNTPRRTPAHSNLRRGGHVKNLSFCLSPLVRASPNRQWNQPEVVLSGEIRGPVKPHLSNTKSFCANRSRKLADFGRTNPNR